jgi:hypothetical protein
LFWAKAGAIAASNPAAKTPAASVRFRFIVSSPPGSSGKFALPLRDG